MNFQGHFPYDKTSISPMFRNRRVRKRENEEENTSMTEDIATTLDNETKKLRISGTPGELFLTREMEHLAPLGYPEYTIEHGSRPCQVILVFAHDYVSGGMFTSTGEKATIIQQRQHQEGHIGGGSVVPCKFIITVGSHYPHTPPSVHCCDAP
jgi:hypothetical protein